jgi:aspartate/methionine/tyrosine aminotransferase
MYERTIISDGASKTWAMTGWRIGFTSNPVLAPRSRAGSPNRVLRLADLAMGGARGDHRPQDAPK